MVDGERECSAFRVSPDGRDERRLVF